MKALTTLTAVLTAISSLTEQNIARDYWNRHYNPTCGYLNIRHRSQKKQRIIARRRNLE